MDLVLFYDVNLCPGTPVLDLLRKDEQFVRCLHAVGKAGTPGWPCDPSRTIILHKPTDNEIVSYGKFIITVNYCYPSLSFLVYDIKILFCVYSSVLYPPVATA